jgi:DNA-binding beta-propeller fold protein YncE
MTVSLVSVCRDRTGKRCSKHFKIGPAPIGKGIMRNRHLTITCAILLAVSGSAVGQGTKSGYKIAERIKIGGEGGWDYSIVDTSSHRLYLSHATRVVVFDTETKTIVGEIPNTMGVHGIALAHDLGRGYTSNGRDSSVTVFDLKTLKVLANIKLQQRNPDAILYDPDSKRVFTFNGGSANATALNADTYEVVGTVPLGGKPEFAVTDLNGKVYVNIENKSTVAAFDAKSLKVLAQWPLAPGEEASGLAIDREHHRLFSVCSNKLMVVLDDETGKVITSVPIGAGVDAAAYDPETHLAFSSNGEGTMTVVQQASADKYSVLENVTTQRGCRTMALDAKTHKVYMAGAEYGAAPAPTAERPNPRPPMQPGSFMVVILDR